MIRGTVGPARADGTGLEARIPIDISTANGFFHTLEAVVDTGFTGWLSLPESVIQELGLSPARQLNTTLANGQSITTQTYAAALLWHGQPVSVWAQSLDSKPMIGAELLADSRLTIDWWDGGDVIIEERTPPAR